MSDIEKLCNGCGNSMKGEARECLSCGDEFCDVCAGICNICRGYLCDNCNDEHQKTHA